MSLFRFAWSASPVALGIALLSTVSGCDATANVLSSDEKEWDGPVVYDFGGLDDPTAVNSSPGGSSLRRWNTTELRYSFLNNTPDLGQSASRDAVERALRVWHCATGIRFVRVDGFDAEINFGWFSGGHGDGKTFDGPSNFLGDRDKLPNVLGHTFMPPRQGDAAGELAGEVHFDEDELWSDDVEANLKADLVTVALHEIGHALGLNHSTDRNSIMFPTYLGTRRGVAQQDIDAITQFYSTTPANDQACK